MPFIAKAKEALGANPAKAKDFVTDTVDKIEGAIEKAGDVIDEKTGGKFSETIDKVQGAAHTAVDKVTEAAGSAKDSAAGAADAAADVADKVDGQ